MAVNMVFMIVMIVNMVLMLVMTVTKHGYDACYDCGGEECYHNR